MKDDVTTNQENLFKKLAFSRYALEKLNFKIKVKDFCFN